MLTSGRGAGWLEWSSAGRSPQQPARSRPSGAQALGPLGYVLSFVVFGLVAWSLAFPGSAWAPPPPPPPQQALAVTRAGVVWFDQGRLSLQGFRPGRTALGAVTAGGRWVPQLSSSAVAVAGLLSEGEFVGGVPPPALRAIAQPRPVRGSGCRRWEPDTRPIGDFVVAASDLVVAGACESREAGAVTGQPLRQPLFLRELRGGRWRVLRWLGGDARPILAAEGGLLAIGEEHFASPMRVSIVDVGDGRTAARFSMPEGYLAFASRRRLVLSAVNRTPWPLEPVVRLGRGSYGGPGGDGGYRLALYSTGGRFIAELGSAEAPALVSHMHLLSDAYSESEGEVFSVRALPAGPPRRVIGFRDPARSLVTLAFRWPTLTAVQTTSSLLAPSQFNCFYGQYGPPSSPALSILNLARSTRFLPAPPPPPASKASMCPADARQCRERGAARHGLLLAPMTRETLTFRFDRCRRENHRPSSLLDRRSSRAVTWVAVARLVGRTGCETFWLPS